LAQAPFSRPDLPRPLKPPLPACSTMALRFAAVVASFVCLARSDTTVRPTMEEWEAQKAGEAAVADAKVAKQKKMSAVEKAVELLESLQKKVLEEGEAEAKSYDKFACFCKETTTEKVQAIQKGEDSKTQLVADIESLRSKRDGHDKLLQDKADEIAAHQKEQKQADGERAAAKTLYDTNTADLQAALDALTGAIKTLKASKQPSFAQLQSVSETVRTATMFADALGVGGSAAGKALAMLQEAPANEVQMQDYNFHSDDIIKTLETLLDQFRSEKVSVDEAEVSSIKGYESLTQELTHAIKMANEVIAKTKQAREDAIAEIEASHQELATVEATLLQDKEYTNELSKMCSDKAKTWDQRSNLREQEITTLTQAIGIVKGAVTEKTTAATVRFAQQSASVRLARALAHNAGAMQAIEAAAEEADAGEPVSFVQRAQRPWRPSRAAFLATGRRLRGSGAEVGVTEADGKDAVVSMLRRRGRELRSALLASLATKLAADPFAKVKVLIQELIERLLQEAANEANHKGWCDKATADAKQRRDYAAEEMEGLNSELARLWARGEGLREQAAVLTKEIQQLKDDRDEAAQQRKEESEENKRTVDEAQDGLDAMNMVIDLLEKFYKTAKKEAVALSLVQGPADDAPDAGFENGEAYLGAQSESGGVLAMLDVMKSDFVRTIEETQLAEERAQRDHLDFMTETGKTLAQKEEAESQVKGMLADATTKYDEADTNLQAESGKLKAALSELLELKPVCIDTGMSYDDRVALREDEIEALKKALCILGKYAEYGPEGAADAC